MSEVISVKWLLMACWATAPGAGRMGSVAGEAGTVGDVGDVGAVDVAGSILATDGRVSSYSVLEFESEVKAAEEAGNSKKQKRWKTRINVQNTEDANKDLERPFGTPV